MKHNHPTRAYKDIKSQSSFSKNNRLFEKKTLQ
jgi:hypothetical protein